MTDPLEHSVLGALLSPELERLKRASGWTTPSGLAQCLTVEEVMDFAEQHLPRATAAEVQKLIRS